MKNSLNIDLAKSSFTQCRGVLKSLKKTLSHQDTCIPRITIRALKCLAQDDIPFQDAIIYHNIIAEILRILKSSDKSDETSYWSVMFLHMILVNDKSHHEFLLSGGLPTIIKLGMESSAQTINVIFCLP